MSNLPVPAPISEADYEAIEAAVMETARGRWFLAAYARRNRHADTNMLLKALDRIEASIRGQGSVDPVDRIRFDLVEMSKAIARTKAEIAAIKPDAEHQGKFGEATEELDSVVQATEAATSDILACAESIQEIAWTLREQGLAGEVCDLLDAKATDIYTACSFQDLTGQRTRKVIGVLRYLENRINAMIKIWGLDSAASAKAPETRAAEAEASLLNGPARPGQGLDQADVDMVMGAAPTAAGNAHVEQTAAPAFRPQDEVVEEAEWSVVDADPLPVADVVQPERIEPAAEVVSNEAAVSVQQPDTIEVEAPQPKSRVTAEDPLAPIMAMSAEERLALFT